MSKLLILFFIFLATNESHANFEELKDVITDPAVSRRCKALLNARADKIRVQQKLQSLILRNKKMQKQSKPEQNIVKTRLELNLIQLNNNLKLTELNLKASEENIVRKGCPGITL